MEYHANGGGGGSWHANRRTPGQLSFEGRAYFQNLYSHRTRQISRPVIGQLSLARAVAKVGRSASGCRLLGNMADFSSSLRCPVAIFMTKI